MTPEFIKSMKDVGFVTVSEDQLVRMRIHKVDAQFVRDARADGLTSRLRETPWISPFMVRAGGAGARVA